MEELKILKKLISFNTVSKNSNKAIADFLSIYFKKLGFEEKIIKKDNFYLLFFTIGRGKENLVISCHTDTVPPGDGWKTNPFKLIIKNNKAFGLGACDVKGSIASVMVAVKELNLKNLNKKFGLIFTFKEETDFSGVKLLNKKMLKGYDKVIVCEPSNMIPAVGHKGAVAYEVIFKGKEAHSSQPDLGLDAIEAENYFAAKLYELKEESKRNIINKKFTPSYTTFNIGEVSGGGVINKVPGKAILRFEYRPIKGVEIKKYDKKINFIAKQTKNKFKFIKIKIRKMISLLPFEPNIKSDFIKKIQLICGKTVYMPYATEASIYNSFGLEAIVLGVSKGLCAHKPNEYIEIKQLKKATFIFKRLIE